MERASQENASAMFLRLEESLEEMVDMMGHRDAAR